MGLIMQVDLAEWLPKDKVDLLQMVDEKAGYMHDYEQHGQPYVVCQEPFCRYYRILAISMISQAVFKVFPVEVRNVD